MEERGGSGVGGGGGTDDGERIPGGGPGKERIVFGGECGVEGERGGHWREPSEIGREGEKSVMSRRNRWAHFICLNHKSSSSFFFPPKVPQSQINSSFPPLHFPHNLHVVFPFPFLYLFFWNFLKYYTNAHHEYNSFFFSSFFLSCLVN